MFFWWGGREGKKETEKMYFTGALQWLKRKANRYNNVTKL